MRHSAKVRPMLVAGAALVAAAGTFATALNEETASHTAPTVLSIETTLGKTTTMTAAPSAPLNPFARPTLKANVPCGYTFACC
jgi:hypothetical protein